MGKLKNRIPDDIKEAYEVTELENKGGENTMVSVGSEDKEVGGPIVRAVQASGFDVRYIDWEDEEVIFEESENVQVVNNTDIDLEQLHEKIIEADKILRSARKKRL